jgi:hypothetical protein
VNIARKSLVQRKQTGQDIVVKYVVDSVEESSDGVHEVYDLMVFGCHEYFANGVLVHNCIDSITMAMYSHRNRIGRYLVV